jgi:hypothetical protein
LSGTATIRAAGPPQRSVSMISGAADPRGKLSLEWPPRHRGGHSIRDSAADDHQMVVRGDSIHLRHPYQD